MGRDGPRWAAMGRDGPRWAAMGRDGPRWAAMGRDGPRWAAMGPVVSRATLPPGCPWLFWKPAKGPRGAAICRIREESQGIGVARPQRAHFVAPPSRRSLGMFHVERRFGRRSLAASVSSCGIESTPALVRADSPSHAVLLVGSGAVPRCESSPGSPGRPDLEHACLQLRGACDIHPRSRCRHGRRQRAGDQLSAAPAFVGPALGLNRP
jgi:hypothetical protein